MKGLDMKGLIDIEAHNKKVAEIEAAKKLLDAGKCKKIKQIKIKKTIVEPCYNNDGSISDTFRISPSSWNDFLRIKISELQEIAACVFVAVGIPQELIDSVMVE